MSILPMSLDAGNRPFAYAGSRAGLLSLVALSIAGWAGALVLRWQPVDDAPGIVGVPLVDGYSEASESAALGVFVAICVLVGVAGRRWRVGASTTAIEWTLCVAGSLALIGLTTAGRSVGPMNLLLGLCLCGAAGAVLAKSRLDSLLARLTMVCLAGALSISVQPALFVELGWWRASGLLGVLVGTEAWLRRRERLAFASALEITMRWFGVGVIVSLATAQTLEIVWALLGAAAFTVVWGCSGDRRLALAVALAGLLCLFSADLRDSAWVYPIRPLVCSLSGGAAAGIVVLLTGTGSSHQPFSRLARATRAVTGLVVTVLFVLAVVSNPWAAAVVLTGWLAWRGRNGRPGLRTLLSVAALWLAFLRIDFGTMLRPVDSFHEGQLISGVWEFDHGRTLFDECAPLRFFDFWMAWISEHIWPKDLVSFRAVFELAEPIGPIGVFLLVLAVTRSGRWSLLTAILSGLIFADDYRVGVALVGVAMVLWFGRRAIGTRLIGLILATSLSAWLGFDVLATVFAASLAAIVTSARLPNNGSWRRLCASTGLEAGAFVVGFVGLHSAIVAIAQGPRSAVAYWTLLADYSRYYQAFYGMPIEWSYSETRWDLVPFGLALGVWLTVSAWAWKRLLPRERQIAAVLAFTSLVIAQRAIGRSDSGHLAAVAYPTLILTSIALRRVTEGTVGRRFPIGGWSEYAFLLLVLVVAITSTPLEGPITSLRQWREAAKNCEISWPQPDPAIAQHLDADDAVWEIQDALMPYTYRRHNATRHDLAYCIGWPGEQLRARDAIRRRSPKIIGWKSLGPNEISNPLRYYLIADDLFDGYRPSRQGRFLIRTQEPWRQWSSEFSQDFGGLVRMGNLASTWANGFDVAQFPSTRRIADPLPSATSAVLNVNMTTSDRVLWIGIRGVRVLDPFLYDRSRRRMILRFAGPGDDGLLSGDRVEFDVALDREPKYYLVPIGCSPAWSWRASIDRIVLTSDGEFAFEVFDVRALPMRLGDLRNAIGLKP